MHKAIAVVFASVALVSIIALVSGAARKPGEPSIQTESRQPESTAKIQQDSAAVAPPAGEDDLDTARALQHLRETKRTIRSAIVAYHTIMCCDSVAMEFAMMGGGDRSCGNRIPPGVRESLNALPLESLPDEVNRAKDDPLIPPEERRKVAELWTLCCDLKSLVDNPRTYSYTKFDELRRRFDRIVENNPATGARSAENRVAKGSDKAVTDPFDFMQDTKERIAAAKERLAMAEKYQKELRQIQNDGKQEIKRIEQKQLEVERQINNQQFERWLLGTPPRQEGEELVNRSRTKRIAAQHALQNGNTQLGERLFWDAADAAMRASNIDQTHQSGEVALRLVIEEYRGCVSPEHDPVAFVRRINNRQFDLWLIGQSPRQQGEALVRRCDELLTDAKHAFKKGNTQYGEDLLWDAADAATRAAGINDTQRLGEFAVKRVIEAFRTLSQREVASVIPPRNEPTIANEHQRTAQDTERKRPTGRGLPFHSGDDSIRVESDRQMPIIRPGVP